MLGWIVATVVSCGWFTSIVLIGNAMLKIKSVIIRLAEAAGVDADKELAALGLKR